MRRRRGEGFDRRSMALSAILHGAILALAWMSTFYQPTPMEFIAYEIELVSPLPARQAEEAELATEELVIERPDPTPTPPEPEVEEIVPVEAPEPEPDPPPKPREEPAEAMPPDPAEETVTAAAPTPPPEETPTESGEGLNVRMEGLRRDYPQYYDNIIRQIIRCFRWTDGGSWETMVFFYITRAGSAVDVEFVTRSGNVTFDYQAMGAVECAGEQGRFGPLPSDLPYDRFPVRFRFQPGGSLEMTPMAGPTPIQGMLKR